jgi:hypothetical protein
MDAATIDVVMPALLAAIGAYGRDVLNHLEKSAADGTVGLGVKLLARFRRGKRPAAIEEAVADVAENPGDEDFETALRAQLKKALAQDPELAADVVKLLDESGISATATGERAVAVGVNDGIISVGDGATNRIER